MLTDQEASDIVLERYRAEGPFEDAAKLLVGLFHHQSLTK